MQSRLSPQIDPRTRQPTPVDPCDAEDLELAREAATVAALMALEPILTRAEMGERAA